MNCMELLLMVHKSVPREGWVYCPDDPALESVDLCVALGGHFLRVDVIYAGVKDC